MMKEQKERCQPKRGIWMASTLDNVRYGLPQPGVGGKFFFVAVIFCHVALLTP